MIKYFLLYLINHLTYSLISIIIFYMATNDIWLSISATYLTVVIISCVSKARTAAIIDKFLSTMDKE